MISSDGREPLLLRGLDVASHQQISRFAILLALLILWSLAFRSERPLLLLSTMAFVAAGLEVVRACLRREPLNGDSLNHWDAAFAGVSSLALGIS